MTLEKFHIPKLVLRSLAFCRLAGSGSNPASPTTPLGGLGLLICRVGLPEAPSERCVSFKIRCVKSPWYIGIVFNNCHLASIMMITRMQKIIHLSCLPQLEGLKSLGTLQLPHAHMENPAQSSQRVNHRDIPVTTDSLSKTVVCEVLACKGASLELLEPSTEPPPSFACCGTLGKSPSLSEAQCPHLPNRNSLGLCTGCSEVGLDPVCYTVETQDDTPAFWGTSSQPLSELRATPCQAHVIIISSTLTSLSYPLQMRMDAVTGPRPCQTWHPPSQGAPLSP